MLLGLALLAGVGGWVYMNRDKGDPQPNLDPSIPRPGVKLIDDKLVRRVMVHRELVARKVRNRSRLQGRAHIVCAVIARESSGDPNAVSSEQAYGLMQVRQAALTDYNQAHGTAIALRALAESAEIQVEVGTWYLDHIWNVMGSLYDALRAYNAGPTGARRNPAAAQNYARWIIDRALPRFSQEWSA
jgi:hypothetical protein